MRFRLLFKRLQTADDLDIKPAREQSLKPVCIGSRGFRLNLCEQSGQSALAACRQCYQTVSATFQHVEYNMRLFLNRATRSEERRGGKEGVSTGKSRWAPYH